MRFRSLIVRGLMFAIVVGCSAEKKQSIQRETSHLRWLLRLYIYAYQTDEAPLNEEEFKQFIANMDQEVLQRTFAGANVASLDQLFISERDGQPYIFLYGTAHDGVTGDMVAFEQTGKGGKRYVGFRLGDIGEVDDQRFAELVAAASRTKK